MRTTGRAVLASFSVVLALGASFASGATFTVTNTNDSGAGSLRQAMTDANGNAGDDTIAFNVPGSGVHTIAPASALPDITEAVTIDGYTQPGSAPNSNPPNQGTNAVIQIEIDGTHTGITQGSAALIVVSTGGGTIIRGLAINRAHDGILIDGAPDVKVEGCFVGTDPTGEVPVGNIDAGILVDTATNATIGGTTPLARNVIAVNAFDGILIRAGSGHAVEGNLIGTNAAGTFDLSLDQTGVELVLSAVDVRIGGTTAAERNVVSGNKYGIRLGASDSVVEGNYIGTDVTGAAPLGNDFDGVSVEGPSNTIGGSAAGAGNVISGNFGHGIEITSAGTIVQGNLIGLAADGVSPMGNIGRGVSIFAVNNATVGGVAAGEANTIAFNGIQGVGVYSIPGAVTSGKTIRGNPIYGNGTLGIDLGVDGVTPDDAGDGDDGPNALQNYPIVGLVTPGASSTNVQGTLNSTASTTFDVDLFAAPACLNHPQDFLQGQQYLGTTQVTTDATGLGSFSLDVPFVLAAGQPVVATATAPDGSTSEFS